MVWTSATTSGVFFSCTGFSPHMSQLSIQMSAPVTPLLGVTLVIIKDTKYKMKEISGSRLKAAQINPIAFLLLILITVNFFWLILNHHLKDLVVICYAVARHLHSCSWHRGQSTAWNQVMTDFNTNNTVPHGRHWLDTKTGNTFSLTL